MGKATTRCEKSVLSESEGLRQTRGPRSDQRRWRRAPAFLTGGTILRHRPGPARARRKLHASKQDDGEQHDQGPPSRGRLTSRARCGLRPLLDVRRCDPRAAIVARASTAEALRSAKQIDATTAERCAAVVGLRGDPLDCVQRARRDGRRSCARAGFLHPGARRGPLYESSRCSAFAVYKRPRRRE